MHVAQLRKKLGHPGVVLNLPSVAGAPGDAQGKRPAAGQSIRSSSSS